LLTSVPELLDLAVCDALLVSEEEADDELDAVCRVGRRSRVETRDGASSG
jgi:hypothetical protein